MQSFQYDGQDPGISNMSEDCRRNKSHPIASDIQETSYNWLRERCSAQSTPWRLVCGFCSPDMSLVLSFYGPRTVMLQS
jgi:hypothetical protein